MGNSWETFDHLGARILTHYDSLKTLKAGGMPPPRTAIIYPVYGCNIDCLGCEYVEDNDKGFTYLNRARFKELLRELAELGVQGVEFCGGGEPTLYPHLDEMCRYGHDELGLQFGLLTNGIGVRGELLEEAARHFAYVRYSVEAVDADEYMRVKRPKHSNPFDRIFEQAKALIARRNELGSALKVSHKFLISEPNRGSLRRAVELAVSVGFDSIQFKALRLDDAELSPEAGREVDAEIAALREEFEGQIPVVGSVAKVDSHSQCWLTPLQTMIDAYGDVLLCCYFRRRREEHRIGNIYDGDFKTIWYGERHQEARSKIDPVQCNALDCRFVRYQNTVEKLLVSGEGQFEFI